MAGVRWVGLTSLLVYPAYLALSRLLCGWEEQICPALPLFLVAAYCLLNMLRRREAQVNIGKRGSVEHG